MIAELRLYTVETPLGRAWVATDAHSVVYGFDWDHQRLQACLSPRSNLVPQPAVPEPLGTALARYFAGDLGALAPMPVSSPGTDFQQRVWAEVRALPPGAPASYREIAIRLGAIGAERAIGAANAANPLLLFVPCHRVVGADGSLTGYAAGLPRKRWLLDHEAQHSHPVAPALPFPTAPPHRPGPKPGMRPSPPAPSLPGSKGQNPFRG